ncbi:MAG: hypothetical protein AB7D03_08240 [Thiomicrospira sp.]
MNAQEFDAKFDAGEDIFDQLDLANAKRPMQKHKRVNVDFPAWMLNHSIKKPAELA